MKKSKYIIKTDVNQGVLYYSSFKDSYILLNKRLDQTFKTKNVDFIKENEPELYGLLMDNGFIVQDEVEELKSAQFSRMLSRMDSTCYQVSVNTTLDCNLDCWYCHENKKKGTKLSENVINLVVKNIESVYFYNPYNKLKLSFFGGEPLLRKGEIKKLIEFANNFCKKK